MSWIGMITLIWIIQSISFGIAKNEDNKSCDSQCWNVWIYHLIDNALWGETDGSGLQGQFTCFNHFNPLSSCELITSVAGQGWLSTLNNHLKNNRTIARSKTSSQRCCSTTVGLYHIHTWGTLSPWPHVPDRTILPTQWTMAESEESHGRFQRLFTASFKHFDGNSTTSPFSTVQRSYFRGWNISEFLPLQPPSQLIPAAAFVASTCHRGDSKTKRISFVKQLQEYLRVDSLGKCIQSKNIPEGIILQSGQTEKETLRLKQVAISRYMFYLAFENTYERGYVTEKVFDALIAGSVPVYLGSTEDCKELMPHPKAAIYVSDFGHNASRLGEYLNYLMKNTTAYEEHRLWRQSFNGSQGSNLLTKSWPCRICEWAVQKTIGVQHSA